VACLDQILATDLEPDMPPFPHVRLDPVRSGRPGHEQDGVGCAGGKLDRLGRTGRFGAGQTLSQVRAFAPLRGKQDRRRPHVWRPESRVVVRNCVDGADQLQILPSDVDRPPVGQ